MSNNVIQKFKEELELHKLNCEWQEDFEGLFCLLKHNNSEDKNKNGNWFNSTEFNYGAIQFPETTEELFLVTKSRHLNFFESLKLTFEFWTDTKINNYLMRKSTNSFVVILIQTWRNIKQE